MAIIMSEKRFKKFGSAEQYNNLLDYAFLNYDGTILQEGKLKKGETPVYDGETPTKPDAGQYRYEFIGWSPEIHPLRQDQTEFVAEFEAILNNVTLTIVNDNPEKGTLDKEEVSVTIGSTLEFTGDAPNKHGYIKIRLNGSLVDTVTLTTNESSPQYDYFFDGWWIDGVNVFGETITIEEDLTVNAKCTQELREYEVNFKNYDGTILQTVIGNYGDSLSYTGATPTKPNETGQFYTKFNKYIGFDDKVDTITGDKDYTAQYMKYSVEFSATVGYYGSYTGRAGDCYDGGEIRPYGRYYEPSETNDFYKIAKKWHDKIEYSSYRIPDYQNYSFLNGNITLQDGTLYEGRYNWYETYFVYGTVDAGDSYSIPNGFFEKKDNWVTKGYYGIHMINGYFDDGNDSFDVECIVVLQFDEDGNYIQGSMRLMAWQNLYDSSQQSSNYNDWYNIYTNRQQTGSWITDFTLNSQFWIDFSNSVNGNVFYSNIKTDTALGSPYQIINSNLKVNPTNRLVKFDKEFYNKNYNYNNAYNRLCELKSAYLTTGIKTASIDSIEAYLIDKGIEDSLEEIGFSGIDIVEQGGEITLYDGNHDIVCIMKDRNIGQREYMRYNTIQISGGKIQNISLVGQYEFWNDECYFDERKDISGTLFQWGNNCGWVVPLEAYQPMPTITQGQVNASVYGPGNYYYSSDYKSGPNSWTNLRDSSNNRNLWGGTTNTQIARQGPCDNGWHVPSVNEMDKVLRALSLFGYKLLEKKEGKEINMATFDRYGDGIIKLFCWFFKFPSGMLGIYGYNVPSSGYNLSTSNQRIWLSDVADPGYNPIDGGALLDMEMINGEEQSSSGIFPNKMFGISYDGSIGFYPIRPFKNLS